MQAVVDDVIGGSPGLGPGELVTSAQLTGSRRPAGRWVREVAHPYDRPVTERAPRVGERPTQRVGGWVSAGVERGLRRERPTRDVAGPTLAGGCGLQGLKRCRVAGAGEHGHPGGLADRQRRGRRRGRGEPKSEQHLAQPQRTGAGAGPVVGGGVNRRVAGVAELAADRACRHGRAVVTRGAELDRHRHGSDPGLALADLLDDDAAAEARRGEQRSQDRERSASRDQSWRHSRRSLRWSRA